MGAQPAEYVRITVTCSECQARQDVHVRLRISSSSSIERTASPSVMTGVPLRNLLKHSAALPVLTSRGDMPNLLSPTLPAADPIVRAGVQQHIASWGLFMTEFDAVKAEFVKVKNRLNDAPHGSDERAFVLDEMKGLMKAMEAALRLEAPKINRRPDHLIARPSCSLASFKTAG